MARRKVEQYDALTDLQTAAEAGDYDNPALRDAVVRVRSTGIGIRWIINLTRTTPTPLTAAQVHAMIDSDD